MENLKDIVRSSISATQVALLGEVHKDGTVSLNVVTGGEPSEDPSLEGRTRALALAFNGVVVYFGNKEHTEKMVKAGTAAVIQAAALEEAEKEG